MNTINITNNKINRHIIIKRRKKKQNDAHLRDLIFNDYPKLDMSHKEEIKMVNKRNINYNNFSNNNNISKLTSFQIPKIKINLYTINHNNKKSKTISSEKNRPISCKVHKSKEIKIIRKRNIISNYSTQYKNNSTQNKDEINQKENMTSLNYFNIIQRNNLNLLNYHLDNLINNKETSIKKIQSIQPKNNKEEILSYNNKKINIPKEKQINEYKKPIINIYKKKSIPKKYSFSINNTHKNTISDISSLTIEQKDNNKENKRIYNKLIKNQIKNNKVLKFIKNGNIIRNKNKTDLINSEDYNFINSSYNSPLAISYMLNQGINANKYINKNPISLNHKDINVFRNNYYICNYINKDTNNMTFD